MADIKTSEEKLQARLLEAEKPNGSWVPAFDGADGKTPIAKACLHVLFWAKKQQAEIEAGVDHSETGKGLISPNLLPNQLAEAFEILLEHIDANFS